MLYKFYDKDLEKLIYCIKSHIKPKKAYIKDTGLFSRADICEKLTMSSSRNYIFDFFSNYSDMKTISMFKNKRFYKDKLNHNKQIAKISKRSHFACFRHKNLFGIKPYPDINESTYLYYPLKSICEEMVNKYSKLGMNHIETIQYFNFIDLYYETNSDTRLFILNLYKGTRLSVFSFNEVQEAIKSYDVLT